MPAAMGGMSIGADPITAAVVTMSGCAACRWWASWFARKPRGTAPINTSKGRCGRRSVVIVEDVVTTGGSSFQAIERVEAFGLKVSG